MSKYVIRYSDKYKKVALFKVISEEIKNDSIYDYSIYTIQYKNEVIQTNPKYNTIDKYDTKFIVIRM